MSRNRAAISAPCHRFRHPQGGQIHIAYFGRYGGRDTIAEWWDLAVVGLFSLIVYYAAVHTAMTNEDVAAVLAAEDVPRTDQERSIAESPVTEVPVAPSVAAGTSSHDLPEPL